MEFIQATDFFEIKTASVLTDYDRRILCELYQPLIGHCALALFFTLWTEYERKDYLDLLSHDYLFSIMQISPSEVLNARRALEAIGLMRTYVKVEKETKIFCYELFSPKYPAEFFNDPLFAGMITKFLGEKEASRLANSFKKGSLSKDYQEVSCRFHDIFKLEYDDACFDNKLKDIKTKRRIAGDIISEFDFAIFFAKLEKEYLIKQTALSPKDIKEVERLSLLYGISEEMMADCFMQAYNSHNIKSERIDYHQLNDAAREMAKYPILSKSSCKTGPTMPTSDSIIAEKIKLMEQVSCYDFLRYRQKNTTPATPDLQLVNDLSNNFGLNIPVINALVDYVLSVKNNVLSRAYTEKIAATLAREGITTAQDAMDYLLKIKRTQKVKKVSPEKGENHLQRVDDKEEANDEEYQKLLMELRG